MSEQSNSGRDPKSPIAGRGALSNTPIRFERITLSDDYRDGAEPDLDRGRPTTQFYKDHTKSILTRNDSPDIGFEFSINPYRGCEHGCIYCYARPTHEYLGLSAGIDFETKIFVKENAPELLREKLMSKSYKPHCISVSGVTDPYQPVERKLQVTRRCLEVLREFRNPFTIITKNHLVTRDLDILSDMAKLRSTGVFLTISTLDADLCSILEPRTSRPQFRLHAVKELSEAGVPVGVMVAPVIPAITDHEMPAILKAASEAGARFAGYVPLRLPFAVKDLFSEWLGAHFPDRKERVLSRIRSLRGGKLNDSEFGSRMEGEGPFAEQLKSIFKVYSRRNGLNETELDITAEHFQRPGEQLKLF